MTLPVYCKTFEERRLAQIQKRVEKLEQKAGKESSDSAIVAEIKRTFKGFSEDIKELHNQIDNLKNAVSVNKKIASLL